MTRKDDFLKLENQATNLADGIKELYSEVELFRNKNESLGESAKILFEIQSQLTYFVLNFSELIKRMDQFGVIDVPTETKRVGEEIEKINKEIIRLEKATQVSSNEMGKMIDDFKKDNQFSLEVKRVGEEIEKINKEIIRLEKAVEISSSQMNKTIDDFKKASQLSLETAKEENVRLLDSYIAKIGTSFKKYTTYLIIAYILLFIVTLFGAIN